MTERNNTCRICGLPIDHTSFAITMWEKGMGMVAKPPRDDQGRIQEKVHDECVRDVPRGACFPFL